jgi:hypothetical protein
MTACVVVVMIVLAVGIAMLNLTGQLRLWLFRRQQRRTGR